MSKEHGFERSYNQRSIPYLVRRWRSSHVAYMGDLIARGTWFNIQTRRQDGVDSSLAVAPKSQWDRAIRLKGERYDHHNWRVRKHEAPDQLPYLAGAVVHLAAKPLPGSQYFGIQDGTHQKVFPDRLFPEGDLIVSIPGNEEAGTPLRRFNFGAIVGLELEQDGITYPLWSLAPEQAKR